MSTHLRKLWVEKYRPPTLDGFIFQDPKQRCQIERMVSDKSFPHLLLAGAPGTGKTTLAKILIAESNVEECDILEVNASNNNSVDYIRDTIISFAKTCPMGTFKIVHLQEADYLSHNAQGVLRVVMEEQSDEVRFIMTGNYAHKIMPAIRSRSTVMTFKSPDRNDIAERLVDIIIREGYTPDLDVIDKLIAVGFPDVRAIINSAQDYFQNGADIQASDTSDYKLELLDMISAGEWRAARALACGNVAAEEWEDVYKFMYDNIHRCARFGDLSTEAQQIEYENAIVIIADHLGKHSMYADPEINAAAMFINLGRNK